MIKIQTSALSIKSLYFLSFFIAINFSVFSQSFTSDISEGKYDLHNFYTEGIKTKRGNIVLKENVQSYGGPINVIVDKKASLLLTNDKNETIQETPLVFKNSRFINLKGVYQLNGKIVVIYGYKNAKKDNEYTISAIKINEADISLGQEVELGKFQTFSGNDLPNFEFTNSYDSLRYLLFVEADQKNKDMEKFDFAVFNDNLIKQYERSVELPEQRKFVVIESKALDKKGNLYVEFKHFEKEVKNRGSLADEEHSTPPYTTTITEYLNDGKTTNEITLNLGGKYLHDSRLLFNEKTDKVGIAGSYKDEIKGRISGVFYCNYDPSLKVVDNIKMSEIPADIIELFDTEGIAKSGKKDAGISGNFKPKSLSNRNNGTVDYVLEYNQAVERGTPGTNSITAINFTPSTFFKMYSQSILNVNIDNNGKMIFTRIPKNQTDVNSTSYISHYHFYSGNKLIFLYNDDKDNVDKDINKAPDEFDNDSRRSSVRSVLMAAIVDEKGNLERKIVYEHKDDKYVTLVNRLRLIKPNLVFTVKIRTGALLADMQRYKYGVIEVK